MTGQQLRVIREQLGLTQAELANDSDGEFLIGACPHQAGAGDLGSQVGGERWWRVDCFTSGRYDCRNIQLG